MKILDFLLVSKLILFEITFMYIKNKIYYIITNIFVFLFYSISSNIYLIFIIFICYNNNIIKKNM